MNTESPTLPMHELAARIALALGDGWKSDTEADTNSAYAILRREGDDPHYGIGLYRNAREGKITVNPKWPTADDGTEFPRSYQRPDLSIGVGMNREPAAIAREITRRFLPAYRENFDAGTDMRDQHDSYLNGQRNNLAAFAELLGGSVRGETVDVHMGDYDRYGYIHGLQVGGDTLQWEFRSMPVDVARKVLAYWKSLQES